MTHVVAVLQEGATLSASITTGAVCLAAGSVLGPFAVRASEWVRPGRNVFFARWGFAQVLVALIGAVVAAVLVGQFAPAPWDARLATTAGLLAACALALRTAHRLEPTGWRALGLWSVGTWRDHAAALVLLVGCAPLLFGAALLVPALLDPSLRAWPELALAARGGDGVALFVMLVALPLLHELFFRGLLLPLCAQNFSEKGGLLIVGLLGGGLSSASAFVPQVVLGVAAGTLRLRTQRVLPCALLHAAYNGAALWIGPGGGDVPVWTPF